MKKNKGAGMPASFLADIARAAAAGQANEVLTVPAIRSPPEHLRDLCRRIKAAQDLYLENGIIYHSSGVSVAALASWIGILGVRLHGRILRFRLLAVDRKRVRKIYAIPISMKAWRLPDLALSDAELKLLSLMADEISDDSAALEYHIELPHPARNDVKIQRDQWRGKPDQEALLKLLRERPELLSVVTAALDVLLRSFKLFREGPLGLYNFTSTNGDVQADENFSAALRAVNFTAAPSFIGASVPEIVVREQADLKVWRGCYDRLILLRTATGSLLTPLLDEIDERERLRCCGGLLPPRLTTVPIVRSKTVLHRRFAADITLPKGEKALSAVEQDMLRSAMALAANRKVAQAVYDRWRERMSAPCSYRTDSFAAWREVIGTEFLRAVFSGPSGLLGQTLKLFSDSQAEQEQAERDRAALIAHALELIGTPSRFEREIIDRPDSKAAAVQQMDDEQTAVAFRFRPAKGEDYGMHFLAFTRASLLRLLTRVCCGRELLDALLDAAEKSGLLDQRGRTIKLGKETGQFVTFRAEKF